jgi:hypothetical protein
VTDFFDDDSYANKPKAIAKYAKWAIRGNGPALFSKPTPIGCKESKGAKGYIVRILERLNVPLTSVNDDF